jgi:[protein-PII] uridylyltransferase
MDLSAEAVSTSFGKLQSSGQWRQIEQEFLAAGDALTVQSGLTQAVDEIATGAYAAAIQPVLPEGAAMLALSGFGRRDLFPYSDLSILILLETESPWVSLRDVLSEMVRQLWDSGLRVNHAVRTIAECLDVREENTDLRIGLLDQRFLAGDQRVHAQFENRLPAFLAKHGQKLSQHVCQQARLRHARYQNTIRHSQPNVKDTPGGLRDVSLIRWLAKLGSERPHPLDQLNQAAKFLSAARCFLHFRARSDRNVLDFEAQHSLCGQPFARGKSRTEWMREYYHYAGLVSNEARRALDVTEKVESSLLGNFREWRSRLSNSDFTVSRDRLLLRNPGQIDGDPPLVMRLLEFIARHDIAPSADTERRLQAARPALAAYCAERRPLWAAVKAVLALPHSGIALRTLQNTGLLAAVFPEWTHIENLVIADSEHRYTVDEHTLTAVERANELRANADPSRQRFSQLLSEIDNPAVLIFALLYHDTGQDTESSQSCPASAARAREASMRLEMSTDERSDVEFLIQHQADLSDVMSGRDVDDPATARFLAERAGTIERLKLLTILTYADQSAMGSEAMSAWRIEQLWRVYQITRQELTRELETDRIQDVPRTFPGHADFIKGLPVRYLRAHSPSEIEAHLQLYELSRPTGVAVQLDRIEGAYRLTVVARDMPFLFASFAGALSSFGLDILKAEAFSNAKGLILDTFVFADPRRTLELNPPEVDRLQDLMRRVALGKTDGQRLLRNRGQVDPKKRSMEPQIQFDSEACETATLVEIVAEDRPGLLYSLATVFSSTACNIDVVLIDTKGHRAIDVFYVAHDGRKLSPEMQGMLKQKLLAVC